MRQHRPLRPLVQALSLTLLLSGPTHDVSAATAPASAAPSAVATPEPPSSDSASTSANVWAAPLQLAVDATDLAHRVLQVQQTLTLPAPLATQGGPLSLVYPRFLPGAHGPYGRVNLLAGLVISVGDRSLDQPLDRPLAWRRDAVDTHRFHLDVPAGTAALTLRFQYLAPVKPGGDRISITRQMLGVEWETVLLAPADVPVAQLRVQPQLKLPAGWQPLGALRAPDGRSAPQTDAAGWWRFGEVSLETLVDAPLFAGRHVKRVALDAPGTAQPVQLNLVADEPGPLDASPAQLDAHRALVKQATSLFGQRPWRHYDFLLALSDEFGGIGLEHHESSENGVTPDYFKDWDKAIRGRELLPHEFAHAWNGKFRRPADLWTPDYQQPMRTSLLWVYEGQTQFWGHVLAARSGLTTPQQARDRLAWTLAELQARSGRAWRSLQDTTAEPSLGPGNPHDWEDWQRGSDYYDEGLLLWLDVDMLIREESQGRRSLDDFAHAFFGTPMKPAADGSPQALTYTFDDLLAALNKVQPHDWAGFFKDRLQRTGGPAPQDGLTRAGWRLVWTTEESAFAANERGWSGPNGNERPQDLAFSLGLRITSDGKLDQVLWDSPAFRAGLGPGMALLAVNGRGYKPERLGAAVQANRDGQAPITLWVRDGDQFTSVVIDWRGGLRYPALARIAERPDRLSTLYRAR